MNRQLVFKLPEPTILLNTWQRWNPHQRKRHAQTIAWQIREAVGPWREPPFERCRIEIERHSAGIPDWDGLYGGLKPLLDCLVVASKRNPHGLGIIRDDCPGVVLSLQAMPVKSSKKAMMTVVRICEESL